MEDERRKEKRRGKRGPPVCSKVLNVKQKCFKFILMDRKWVDVCREGNELIRFVENRFFLLVLFLFCCLHKKDWCGIVNSAVNSTLGILVSFSVRFSNSTLWKEAMAAGA